MYGFLCAPRDVLLEAFRPVVLPFVHLFTKTWSMCRHPVNFGSDRSTDELTSFREAFSILSRACLFEIATFSMILRIPLIKGQVPNIPLIESILAVAFIVWCLVVSLLFMPFFRLFSGKQLRIYPSVAAFAYWTGCFITIVCTLLLLVGGGMYVLGFGTSVSCNVGIGEFRIADVSFCVLLALGFAVCFAAVVSSLVGFVTRLSVSHSVTRFRVVLALLAFNLFFHLLFHFGFRP